MKSIIVPAVAAFALATTAPALAAKGDSQDHHDGTHQTQHTGPNTQQQQQGPVIHHDMPKPGPVMHDDHHQAPVMHHDTTTHMPPPPVMRHDTTQRYDWKTYQPGHTPPRIRNAPRLDFHVWHRNFNAPRHFHNQPYNRPHDWYYRRWTFGMVLPILFWSQDYWISDYWNYDLPDPPYGYVWVRYGDDALLVNVRSGYILQVEYDLFD
jgi:Ni/Co efflux regulator RcnB